MAKQPIVVRRSQSASRLTEAESRHLHEQISSMAIELVPIESIRSNPRNAKKHPERQILLIAESMRKFGAHHPILIDENNTIIGGHARIAAARLLKLSEIPAIRLSNLNAQEKRAVALADNRLAELGSWNTEILRLELKELTAEAGELTFDYAITGFDTFEIDQILDGDGSSDKPDPADEVTAPVADEVPVTEMGDLWMCGDHRLYCGSGLEAASYRVLLGGAAADLVFADPLSNVPAAGRVPKRSDVREFTTSADTPKAEEFIDFLQTLSTHIAAHVVDGAVIFLCMDWRHLDEMFVATRPFFDKPKELVVWVNTNTTQNSFYRSQHQLIAVYVAGNALGMPTSRLGERRRYRSNVWTFPGCKAFGRKPHTGPSVDLAVKPVALVVDALRDCSKRGEIVLDPFAGFGTTIIAAERVGRRARLIEVDPLFCDLIVRRWQTLSGRDAQLAESNESFAEVQARRIRAGDGRE